MSSRCSAISSTTASVSTTPLCAACARMSACQSNRGVIVASRRTESRDLGQRRNEAAPVLALGCERPAPLVGDAIAAPAALAGALDPSAAHEIALLEPVERRIQGGEREPERPSG